MTEACISIFLVFLLIGVPVLFLRYDRYCKMNNLLDDFHSILEEKIKENKE